MEKLNQTEELTTSTSQNKDLKYQELLNKFAEKNRNLSLCKQFLEVLRDWDFNKIGATQVYRNRIREFLNNMEQ